MHQRAHSRVYDHSSVDTFTMTVWG